MIFLTQLGDSIKMLDGSPSSEQYFFDLDIKDGNTVISEIEGVLIDGYFQFFGAEEVVRAYMLQQNLTVLTLTCVYTGHASGSSSSSVVTNTWTVLYNESYLVASSSITADNVATGRFLTPNKTGFVFAGGSFRLNLYVVLSPGNYVTMTIVYYKKDGTQSQSSTRVGTSGVSAVTFDYDADISRAHIVLGDRVFDLYYLDLPAQEHFRFRNVFNVQEEISLPASVLDRPSSDFESAQQGNRNLRYDIEHNLELELKSALLPLAMRPVYLDLCRSRSVFRKVGYTSLGVSANEWREVNFTEYKLDASTNPNSEFRMEMKMEYVERKYIDAVIVE